MKDETRLRAAEALMDGRLKVGDAARVLGRSERTVYRLVRRVREEGPKGVIHRNRGRRSPRRVPEQIRDKVVALARGTYDDVNDTHLLELLARREGVVMGRETLRTILRQAGMAPKRQRRKKKYRRRRERKEAFGMMLQIDASLHDWLEGRGPYLTLVGTVDDATGHVWARFEESETAWAYFDLMRKVFASHGLPLSLYSDRHSIFHTLREPTIIEQLNDAAPLTQFGRAMDELGITIIKAWSPQAKGRIERQWGTFQDRLVVELRLAGAKTLGEANEVLGRFLADYNPRFKVLPRSSKALFRKPPPAAQLDRILCPKETRTVKKDHTVSFEGLVLQIPPSKKFPVLADRKVDVLQMRDGRVEILYRQTPVATFSPEAIARMLKNKRNSRTNLKAA
jgi:transposase